MFSSIASKFCSRFMRSSCFNPPALSERKSCVLLPGQFKQLNVKPLTGDSSNLLVQNNPCVQHQSVRFRYYYGKDSYKPSAWKRIHKHGFERVVTTTGLKIAVWKKILKGQKDLYVFPRFMNYPVKSKKAQMALPKLRKGLHKFYPYQRQEREWKKY